MILETLRMTADALDDATIGVNVQLAALTLDAADEQPDDVQVVADETRSGEVAVGRYPATLPAVTVTLNDTVDMDGEVISDYRDSEVTVLVRYITKDVATEQGNTNTYYTLRAITKVLREFNRNTNEALRTRNGVQILECKSITHVQLFENIDDAYVTGALRVTFFVRDTTP